MQVLLNISFSVCIAYEMNRYCFLFVFIFNMKIILLDWKNNNSFSEAVWVNKDVFNGLWGSNSEQPKLGTEPVLVWICIKS